MIFDEMPLIAPILKATREAGYEEPTPIQRETIPLVLDGKDVLGCAQTGTGKTAAFALPILQRLYTEKYDGSRKPSALILTPTRELAIQIQENFTLYGKHLPLRSCVIFGGVNQAGQVQQLKRGVQILVATPGRLCDLIGQGYIDLSQIEIFVLDEADRMLDMGFIHDVRRVIALLPANRQTLFFSATMPGEVEKLAMSILNNPETVKVDPVTSTVDTIQQTLYLVDKVNKKLLLAGLLKRPEVENALVFTRTKHGADKVVGDLIRMGVPAMAIHGDKSQNARQAALGQFKNGDLKVLIATDIAARGIDVAGLSHVFNYDLPNEPEAYIHRIGRTGRAGLSGNAISFCCIDEMKCLYAIEKLIGRKIPRQESQWPMEVFTETVKEPRPPRPERVARVNLRGEAVAQRTSPVARRENPTRPHHTQSATPASSARTVAAGSHRPSSAVGGEPRMYGRPAVGNEARTQGRAATGNDRRAQGHSSGNSAPRPQGRPALGDERRALTRSTNNNEPRAASRAVEHSARPASREAAPIRRESTGSGVSTQREVQPQRKMRRYESR